MALLVAGVVAEAGSLRKFAGGGGSGGGGPPPLPPPTRLVFHGDSITAGTGLPVGTRFAELLPGLALAHRGWTLTATNRGDHGAGFTVPGAPPGLNTFQTGVSQIDPLLTATGDPEEARLILLIGTNDFYFGRTCAQQIEDLKTYLAARVAAGWDIRQIIVMQVLPLSTNPVFELNRRDYAGALDELSAEMGFQVVPLAADTTIGQAGQQTNGTYYSDGIHLTAAGHAVIANDIIGPPVNSTCPTCAGIE